MPDGDAAAPLGGGRPGGGGSVVVARRSVARGQEAAGLGEVVQGALQGHARHGEGGARRGALPAGQKETLERDPGGAGDEAVTLGADGRDVCAALGETLGGPRGRWTPRGGGKRGRRPTPPTPSRTRVFSLLTGCQIRGKCIRIIYLQKNKTIIEADTYIKKVDHWKTRPFSPKSLEFLR